MPAQDSEPEAGSNVAENTLYPALQICILGVIGRVGLCFLQYMGSEARLSGCIHATYICNIISAYIQDVIDTIFIIMLLFYICILIIIILHIIYNICRNVAYIYIFIYIHICLYMHTYIFLYIDKHTCTHCSGLREQGRMA